MRVQHKLEIPLLIYWAQCVELTIIYIYFKNNDAGAVLH